MRRRQKVPSLKQMTAEKANADCFRFRVYALKAEKGLEVGVVPRGVELFAFDACLAAGVAAQLVEHHAA